jgi:2-phosphosulfolactate phosphatase
MRIDVYFTPNSLTQKKIEDCQVVIIDALRASTTIVTALANGARAIIPVAETASAVEVRAKLGAEHVLLGGEHEGTKIENFDLGNSPLEYTKEIVKDKVIAMRTTNGTRPYTMFRYNRAVRVGSFLNLGSTVKYVCANGADLALICAGNNGDFSLEDTLAAGAIIDGLADSLVCEIELNDSAKLAALHFNASRERLLASIKESEHGKHLSALGFADDIAFAAQVNTFDISPRFEGGQISVTDPEDSSTEDTQRIRGLEL